MEKNTVKNLTKKIRKIVRHKVDENLYTRLPIRGYWIPRYEIHDYFFVVLTEAIRMPIHVNIKFNIKDSK